MSGLVQPLETAGNRETRLRDVDWLPGERRRQKFFDLYLFAVEACLRGGAKQWWQHAFRHEQGLDLEQGAEQLKELCLRQLLFGTGDIYAFSRIYEVLEEEGFLEGDERGRFILDLTRYLIGALASADQATAQQDTSSVRGATFARSLMHVWPGAEREFDLLARRIHAVVSVVVLDGHTQENFFEFCLPSLLRNGSLGIVNRVRTVDLHIFARERDIPAINRRLEAFNLEFTVICQPIPEDLAARAEGAAGPQTEWLLGALQGLHLMEAKRLHADFYSINPNAVYADAYFDRITRLRRAGESAVALATFYVDTAAIRNELERFRSDRALAAPPAELMGVGLGAIAPSSGARVVLDRGYSHGPTSHFQLIWEGEGGVQIHSTLHEIAFIAYWAVDKLPARFFMKPSTDVDRMFAGDMRPHFVSEADHVAMLGLSRSKDMVDGSAMDLIGFALMVSQDARERQVEYFASPICLEISRSACPQRPWRPSAEIETERGEVIETIRAKRVVAVPTGEQALTALSVLHQYEISEYGLDSMPDVIAEGRRILGFIPTNDGSVDIAVRRELIRASMNFDYVAKAIALAKDGGDDSSFIHDFLIEMTKLKVANEARARRLRPGFGKRRFAVVGTIVWGQPFVDKFMEYCLASLLAPGNIPALAKKKRVVLSIVTTEADRERIAAHPAFARLRQSAEVVFTCFPPEFLERRERDGLNFYHFYGLLDHQNVFLAATLRADLYLLPIDCVYSRDCLRNFSAYLEKEADCCSVGAIEADELELRAWLDAGGRRRAEVLDLPGKELIQAAAQRPDRYFRSMIMKPENTEFCAHPRELVWPSADGLVIHSIFMHPLAVSARLLTRPFNPHHENVDYALLPRLLQSDGRLKVIEDASEATLAHFGAPATRNEYLEGGFSIRSFIATHGYDYVAHRRFFATRQFFPCQDLPYAPSTDYDAELALIRSALQRYRFRADSP